MLPRSPPLPFTQRICFVFPSSGSTCSSFELVFPPPKFVILRSEPSKFDRYRSNSGASNFAATASSQRSSRNRSPLCAVMCQPLPKSSPDYHSTRNTNTATISNVKIDLSGQRSSHIFRLVQRLPRHHPMSHIVIRRHRLPLQQQ